MPSAWVIGPIVLQSTLAVLIVSLILGVIVYFVFGQAKYLAKKQHVDDFMTMLIVFILSLWVAKFITNFTYAFQFPLAVLVYPADRWALYVGIVLAFLYMRFVFMKKHSSIKELILTTFIILISAQFIYKFVYYIMERSSDLIWGMTLYGLLLSLSLIWQQKQFSVYFLGYIMTILGLGNLILASFTRVTFFHFFTDWVFWLVILLIGTFFIILNARKNRRASVSLKTE